MKKIIIIIAAVMLLALCANAQAAQVEQRVDINLPDGVAIEKDNDVTAAMFSRLFGESWKSITSNSGGKHSAEDAAGGLGMFSGLIVSVLGVLNLAAMTFVSAAIVYMWGIFAVTTAHEGGKLGGSMYNSLWVPVRHAFSFSLTVPVLNGLSMLQVGIIAMVSLSINFANVVWDTAGGYISEHAHVGIIDSAAPMLETEAYQMMPVMFEAAVMQELAKASEKRPGDAWAEDDSLGLRDAATPEATKREIYKENYVLETNPTGGYMALYARPISGLRLEDLGAVYIPIAKWTVNMPVSYGDGYYAGEPEVIPPKKEDADISAAVSQARLNAAVALWDDMRVQAIKYITSRESTKGGEPAVAAARYDSAAKPTDYLKSVRTYRASVSKATSEAVRLYVNADETQRRRLAVAIDSQGTDGNRSSTFGWASAGMFSFTLASLQKHIDDEVMQATYYGFRDRKATDKDTGLFFRFTESTYNRLDPAHAKALQMAPDYFAYNVLQNSRYSATDMAQDGDKGMFRTIGEIIAKTLLTSKDTLGSATNKNDKTGVLSAVLEEFGKYDPIVVMQSFGNRLLNAAGLVAGASVLTSTNKFTSGFLGSGIVIAIFAAGVLFAFIVPITPFVFWMRALLSWIFLVVESMVAAPFWACTHSLPEGHGFAGNHARQGYLMLLDILIRPVLLVLGAVFAVAVMQATGWLFATLMNSWFSSIGSFIGMSFLADITFSIVVMSVMYYASLTIFTKGVNYMPEHISRWIGGNTHGLGGEDQDTSQATKIVGGVVSQGGGAANLEGMGQAGGGLYRTAREKLSGKGGGGTTGKGNKTDLPAPITPKE